MKEKTFWVIGILLIAFSIAVFCINVFSSEGLEGVVDDFTEGSVNLYQKVFVTLEDKSCSSFIETADGSWYCVVDKKVYECEYDEKDKDKDNVKVECKKAKDKGNLKRDNVYAKLIQSRGEINRGVAVFEFVNPTSKDIPLKDIVFSFDEFKNKVSSHNSFIESVVNVSRTVEENCSLVCYDLPYDYVNGSNGVYTDCEPICDTYEFIEEVSDGFKPLDFIPKQSKRLVKMIAKYPDNFGSGGTNIEWYPHIVVDGVSIVQDEWATFLTDYGRRQNVSFSTTSFIPSGAFVLISADTSWWTTQDNFQDVRVTADDNTELAFNNLSAKTNDTVFIIETDRAYEPNSDFSMLLYYDYSGETTPPTSIDKIDWAYVPSDGEGNKHFVYDVGGGARYEMQIIGDGVTLSPNGFGNNMSLNISATSSAYLNCSDSAYQSGMYNVDGAGAVSLDVAYEGFSDKDTSEIFYISQGVKTDYKRRHNYYQKTNGKATFNIQVIGAGSVNSYANTIWSQTANAINEHRVTFEFDTAGCDVWYDDGKQSTEHCDVLGAFTNFTSPLDCRIGTCALNPEYWFQGDIKFIIHSSKDRYNLTSATAPSYTFSDEEDSSTAPVCTQSDTNITVLEDSGVWYLDANMSEPLNISCTDANGDALTYTETVDASNVFTNPNNDDLIFTTLANASATYVVTYNVSDGITGDVFVSAQVVVSDVNDPPYFGIIGNATGTKIKTGLGYQPLDINASYYFRDIEEDQTPKNITISTNETNIDCFMNTDANFSIFCKPDSVSVFIITLIGTDQGDLIATTSFEEYVGYPPSVPTIIAPTAGTYHGNITVSWDASISPQGDEIAYYNLTLNDTINSWYYTINSGLNSTSYSWDTREVEDYTGYYVQVKACDNNSLCNTAGSSAFSVNNTPQWDNIGNATATNIYTNLGKQPVLDNVSQYFHDYFDDQTPNSIIVSDNETGISCSIETNFSLFCTPISFEGDYIITLNGTNSVANSSFESFEGSVSNEPPTMPIFLSPEDKHLNDTSALNLSCAGSTDAEGDTIYYDFYGDTNTNPSTLICLNSGGECIWNNTDSNQWVYWYCQSNDTFENSTPTVTRSIRTEIWDIINVNQSAPSLVVQSDNMNFDINVSYNEIRYKGIKAALNISGYNYTTTKIVYDNYTHFSVDVFYNSSLWLDDPLGYTWNISMEYQNGSSFDNLSYGGSFPVFSIHLYNCSGDNESILFNFTGFHEDTIDLLAVNIKGNFDIWTDDKSNAKNYVFEWNSTNVTEIASHYVCLSYNTSVMVNAYLVYDSPGGFTQRYYISNLNYQNNTNNEIHLFNRDYTSGISDMDGTIRHIDTYNYFLNILVKMLRFYPAENIWRTVQMDKSGDFGLVHFNIKEVEDDYKFIFQDEDNNILKQTESMKLSCDPTTNVCELTFLLSEWTGEAVAGALVVSHSFDNDTGIISVNWVDPIGVTSKVRVLVTKENIGGAIEICSSTFTGSAGSYECNASAYKGQLLLKVFSTASPENPAYMEWISNFGGRLTDLIGSDDSAWWVFGVSLTMTMGGAAVSPVAGIIAFIVSLIALFSLGMASFLTIGFITLAAVLGIVIGVKVRS